MERFAAGADPPHHVIVSVEFIQDRPGVGRQQREEAAMMDTDPDPNDNDTFESDGLGHSGFRDEEALDVQEAPTHRPGINIRLRTAPGLPLTFMLTCDMTVAAMVFISGTVRGRSRLRGPPTRSTR